MIPFSKRNYFNSIELTVLKFTFRNTFLQEIFQLRNKRSFPKETFINISIMITYEYLHYYHLKMTVCCLQSYHLGIQNFLSFEIVYLLYKIFSFCNIHNNSSQLTSRSLLIPFVGLLKNSLE